MPIPKLTVEILNAALMGFEEQKKRIDAQVAEIRQLLGGGKPTPESAATPAPTKRKRRMSAAGRKAISEATKKRWAAFHAAKQAEKAEPAVTKIAPAKKAPAKKAAAKNAAKKAPSKTVAKKTPAKKAPAKKPQKKAAKAPEATVPAQAQ